ncbi:type II toxin-antitoxin system PemK/MazF family toxin [Streptomyces polyrhachis]|uniref:Type II toxin-antitoxin system PemK/MazF family toxin n=1 Tax=Streptomyces polyrhachis TaxID=1282885 RepID=A0ABW2GI12_9ACTN
MDTSWWWSAAAAVALALGAGLGAAGRRARRGLRAARHRTGLLFEGMLAGARPGVTVGDIWWARTPCGDRPPQGVRARDRPCLVLRVDGATALVAGITGRFDHDRPGVIPLPPGTVGDARGRPGYLRTGELREVPLGELRRRAGTVDPTVWDQVRYLAEP